MAGNSRIQRLESAVRVIGLAILITLLLGIGSAYFPYSMISEAQNHLAERQKALEQARQAPGQLRILQAQLEQTQRNLAFLERGVSEAAYIPTMLKQIEDTARALNLKIVAIRPQQPAQNNTGGGQNDAKKNNTSGGQNDAKKQQAKPYEEQMIEISLQGHFWSLMSFLKQLDEYPKILAVQTMNLQAKSTTQQTADTNPELEAKFTVKAFIFRNSPPTTQNSQNGG